MRALIAVAVSALALATPVIAKKPAGAWQVIRQSDPVTGRSTCTVAALDTIGGSAFSRAGALYPVIENNPVHGLLVGVSSGGRYRMPTGDMLWRIDDKPFRELKAADNPAPANVPQMLPIPAGTSDAAAKAMQETIANAMKLTAGMTATSTMASGKLARDMLQEMIAGHELIFRPVTASSDYGLPSSTMTRVGQITAKGLRPYPLDESFRAGLAACAIETTGISGAEDAKQ